MVLKQQQDLPLKKKVLFYCFMVILTVAAIEGGLHLVYFLRDWRAGFTGTQKATIPSVTGREWLKELLAEKRPGKCYDPFRGIVLRESHGKHVNISSEGVRQTWNPVVSPGQPAKQVFFFGGSTTWGVCARDHYTLPSIVSKKLNQGQDRFLVTNYGDIAKTASEELIHLVLLLKQGRIPDYVIFYDGVNEVWVGTKNGRPGLTYNFENFRERLEGEGKLSWKVKLDRKLSWSKIYQGFRDLRSLGPPAKDENSSQSQDKEAKLRLAEAIIADYLNNLEVVRHLAQAYGFQYLFLWQPCLFTAKSLTDEEQRLDAWKERDLMAMYTLVYDKMKEVRFPNFHNLTSILDDKDKTLYFTWAHITEEGNEIVAERIFRLFNEEFLRKNEMGRTSTPSEPSG